MSKPQNIDPSVLKAADVPRLLYVASACRLWLRESGRFGVVLRRRAAERHSFKRGRATRWDWSSSGAPVMR
jgi:hypothetical protein